MNEEIFLSSGQWIWTRKFDFKSTVRFKANRKKKRIASFTTLEKLIFIYAKYSPSNYACTCAAYFEFHLKWIKKKRSNPKKIGLIFVTLFIVETLNCLSTMFHWFVYFLIRCRLTSFIAFIASTRSFAPLTSSISYLDAFHI